MFPMCVSQIRLHKHRYRALTEDEKHSLRGICFSFDQFKQVI